MLWFVLLVGLFTMLMFIRPFRWGRPFGWRPLLWRPLPGARLRRRRMWRRW